MVEVFLAFILAVTGATVTVEDQVPVRELVIVLESLIALDDDLELEGTHWDIRAGVRYSSGIGRICGLVWPDGSVAIYIGCKMTRGVVYHEAGHLASPWPGEQGADFWAMVTAIEDGPDVREEVWQFARIRALSDPR